MSENDQKAFEQWAATALGIFPDEDSRFPFDDIVGAAWRAACAYKEAEVVKIIMTVLDEWEAAHARGRGELKLIFGTYWRELLTARITDMVEKEASHDV